MKTNLNPHLYHFSRIFLNCLILILFSTSFIACSSEDNDTIEGNNQTDSNSNVIPSDSIDNNEGVVDMGTMEIPAGYTVLSEDEGDLDGDGLPEKVVVYETERETDSGFEREMRIYVDQDGLWSLWHSSVGAILSSEDGGTLGDPFESVEIVNRNILINHYGGSKDRWSFTHEFRYQGETWDLVAATLVYHSTCDYTETFTYDLIKRSGFHSLKLENCDTNGKVLGANMEIEESLVINAKQVAPQMDGFNPGETPAKIKGEIENYYY